MSQIFDESAGIGARVWIRWTKTVVIWIAERVARYRLGMEHAEPGIVKADSPTRDFKAAFFPPPDEFPKNVSTFENDSGDLGPDREPFPSGRRRVEIDRAALGKVNLSPRASRLKKAAGVIR